MPYCSFLVWITLLQLFTAGTFACSMCKVTINGRTYLGNNEDSWRMGSKIWFEKGRTEKLGVLYVGYGNNFPQGGMNEAGLAFDGLTTYPKTIRTGLSKKHIADPLAFVKEIMQTCKTVEEVKRYAIQYNRQPFLNNGEYLFADKSGNYLVMESDTMITGNDDKYIIANFCPSITPHQERLNWDRYKRGDIFLANHNTGTGADYCLALVDTMHECRKKHGDGTMYSFVADLENGDFTLYFYHDFKHAAKFNLKDELAKGDHALEMPALFPPNAEFKKLTGYKTPRNSTAMLCILYLCGALFLFSSLFFIIGFFRNKKAQAGYTGNFAGIRLLLFAAGGMLLYYLTALVKNQDIFYAAAPYRDYKFSLLTIASYIPFVLLFLIIAVLFFSKRIMMKSGWNTFSKCLFGLNGLAYLTLIVLFAYWGLYDVL